MHLPAGGSKAQQWQNITNCTNTLTPPHNPHLGTPVNLWSSCSDFIQEAVVVERSGTMVSRQNRDDWNNAFFSKMWPWKHKCTHNTQLILLFLTSKCEILPVLESCLQICISWKSGLLGCEEVCVLF